MNIPILYEDENILALNKPSGLVVHADGRTKESTLADWLVEKFPEIKEVGEPWQSPDGKVIYRPGIVHRLDRETSGVIIIAKNQKTFEYLKKLFQSREVHKIYNAFVWGELKQDEGVINKPIGRSKRDFRQWSAEPTARGVKREAVTEYKVLNRGKGFSFVEIYPKTGRTHQIRVHFKLLNNPVIGDSLYAPKREKALGFSRLALHAKSIEFTGLDDKKIHIEAPLPEDFEQAVHMLQNTDEI
jgi:23S rRNA pseudouridine1911/1915/1917 synthase